MNMLFAEAVRCVIEISGVTLPTYWCFFWLLIWSYSYSSCLKIWGQTTIAELTFTSQYNSKGNNEVVEAFQCPI